MQFLISLLLALMAAFGVNAQSSVATSTQTYYYTLSVLRVVATTTVSGNSTVASATPIISANPTGYLNSTSSWTTGTLGATSTVPTPQPSHTNSAARLGMDAVGMAAIAGLIGMVAL